MRGARPERAIEEAIERGGAIRRGERVLAACSGGADSVALAAALAAIAKPMELTVGLAYVNHGVRASAWQDECVVARVAAALGLPLETIAVAAPDRSEAALREARYAALLAAAGRFGAGAVATAHHAADQTETVLMALFRGAGPGGLAGIPPRRPLGKGIDLARPLLRVDPGTLRDACHARALPYCVDSTNADLDLRRNAVRAALERLRPLFPGLDEAVARAAELGADELGGTPRAGLRRRVRERLTAAGELRDVEFAHVEAAVRTLERRGSGRFHMKAGVWLEIDAGEIAGIKRR